LVEVIVSSGIGTFFCNRCEANAIEKSENDHLFYTFD